VSPLLRLDGPVISRYDTRRSRTRTAPIRTQTQPPGKRGKTLSQAPVELRYADGINDGLPNDK
jgi:hypothetical protein